MTYTAAERMQKLRDKRTASGLIEFKIWIKKELLKELKPMLKSIEVYSLEGENTQSLKELKDKLYQKLSQFKDWENYYQEKFQISDSKTIGMKSTEKQRKFAYAISRAIGKPLPNTFTLANKILLGEWIAKQIKIHQIEHIYEWEEIAKKYNFRADTNSLP
ncbi:MAG: hypothetical protein WCR55_10250 [Lentisphaerota bacterium]